MNIILSVFVGFIIGMCAFFFMAFSDMEKDQKNNQSMSDGQRV